MSLNVVGLISGGKDSLYSLAHCIENGHRVIALANLYPLSSVSAKEDVDQGAKTEGDDLNSFMYQTVGHTIIHLYSQALELPLYRREISGSAIQTGRYYDPSHVGKHLDETEDLTLLLKEVLNHHPEVNAVSSGAILSTYQRTRVESVAVRLGLTPLSYLWQYPALPPPIGRGESLTGLLDDMEAAGCDARIIKIASGGIKDSLLWSNVTNSTTKNQILTGLAPFFDTQEFWLRGAVLGEGGEYETLAVNGPPSMWKKKILVDKAGSYTGEGGTSYVRFSDARTDDQPTEQANFRCNLRIPASLDERFTTAQEIMQKLNLRTNTGSNAGIVYSSTTSVDVLSMSYHLTSTNLVIHNLTSSDFPPTVASHDPAIQLKAILDQLPTLLSNILPHLTTSSIVSSNLLLRSISDFTAINPIYSRIWPTGLPNPPARVTIATPLPSGVQVALSLIFSLEPPSQRKGLHVQSRSYWAPANIGPYSQAINVPLLPLVDIEKNLNRYDANLPEAVHMAGQIPLMPASMELLKPHLTFTEHTVLSLQHLWRVGQERGVDLWTWGVAYFAEVEGGGGIENAITARNIWRSTHEIQKHETAESEEEDDTDDQVDIWDLQNNRYSAGGGFSVLQGSHAMTVGKHLHILPNNTINEELGNGKFMYTPPFVAAEVTALPRNARVEWWSMGLAGLVSSIGSRTGNKNKASIKTFRLPELPWGEISGITLKLRNKFENIKTEGAQEDDVEDERPKSDEEKAMATVIFATVLVSIQAMDPTKKLSVPRTSTELLKVIDLSRTSGLEGFSLTNHEVVHATAILNYSGTVSPSHNPHQFLTSPLFAHATTIPSYRLWASPASESPYSKDASQAEDEEMEIREFAAALLLRIDSKSA